jgi:hypothetical protein
VAPPLEVPLLEMPPQESSSSRANRGTRSMNFVRRSPRLKDLKHWTLVKK